MIRKPRVFIIYKKYGLGGYYVSLVDQYLQKYGIKPIIQPALSINHLIKTRPKDCIHIQFPEELYKRSFPLLLIIKALWTTFLLLFLYSRGVKLIWTLHDDKPHESKLSIVDSLFRYILFKVCSTIFVHNNYARQIALSKGTSSNVVLVPHGNFIRWFPNHKNLTKKSARKYLGVPNKNFVYLFFGRIREYKGVFSLISNFKKLSFKNVTLIIAGVPAGKDWDIVNTTKLILREIGNDNRIVPRLEWIPIDQVEYYFKAADIVVLPFKWITTSGSLIASLSFGKPVIVPSLGGIPELIDANLGILYNPNKANSLLNALKRSRKLNLRQLSKNAFNKAKSLSWDEYVKETIKIYRAGPKS
jgi:glycosyltransferase involved in cell wall biosynthesis